MFNPIVWVADVGSVSKKNFGWCRAPSQKQGTWSKPGNDIGQFAKGIARDLCNGKKIALGFECPLFVPVTDEPELLTSPRKGDKDRPWSAAAGCAVLAVGLTECVWIFEKIRKQCEQEQVLIQPTFDWKEFKTQKANLFIWEAFVSGLPNGTTHHCVAQIAAHTFWSKYPNINKEADAVKAQNPYSLVGAALLRSRLSTDLAVLFKPCIVIKS